MARKNKKTGLSASEKAKRAEAAKAARQEKERKEKERAEELSRWAGGFEQEGFDPHRLHYLTEASPFGDLDLLGFRVNTWLNQMDCSFSYRGVVTSQEFEAIQSIERRMNSVTWGRNPAVKYLYRSGRTHPGSVETPLRVKFQRDFMHPEHPDQPKAPVLPGKTAPIEQEAWDKGLAAVRAILGRLRDTMTWLMETDRKRAVLLLLRFSGMNVRLLREFTERQSNDILPSTVERLRSMVPFSHALDWFFPGTSSCLDRLLPHDDDGNRTTWATPDPDVLRAWRVLSTIRTATDELTDEELAPYLLGEDGMPSTARKAHSSWSGGILHDHNPISGGDLRGDMIRVIGMYPENSPAQRFFRDSIYHVVSGMADWIHDFTRDRYPTVQEVRQANPIHDQVIQILRKYIA